MQHKTDFFDSRAESWEDRHYPQSVRCKLKALLPKFGISAGDWILDIGTGPGILIPYLRETAGCLGRVFAFDMSYPMVSQARKRHAFPETAVLQADVHHMPFPDRTFDRVICFAAFPHFETPSLAVHEMARVARPGAGVVIAHLMSREELARHHAAHTTVARDVLPGPDAMAVLFRNAGLTAPDITDISGAYIASGIRMAGACLRENPMAKAPVDVRNPNSGRAVSSLACGRNRRGEAPSADDWLP